MEAMKEGEQWRCNLVDVGVKHVSTPTMLMVHKHDVWQWMSDGGQAFTLEEIMFIMERGKQAQEIVE